jgi:hypothetical protein
MRETQQHFLEIERWYRRWWAQQALQLNQCGASSVPSGVINDALKRFNQAEGDARICSVRSVVQDIPAREDFGAYLGIFGFAARWLLKTESLSLVLITGLLGFGFLGAACSTFISHVSSRGKGEPLVPNLASVVIRGGSAAVLIFLAVYGGLAVFASTNTNPNPYVVLFACLAAAVFSEDAWSWGAQQFRSRLSGGGQDQSRERPREGSETGAGSPEIPATFWSSGWTWRP